MREREWLTCAEPEDLLKFLDGKLSERQLILLACACCKHVCHGFPDPRSQRAVFVVEQFVDDRATLEELKFARTEAAAAEMEAESTHENALSIHDEFEFGSDWWPSVYESAVIVSFARAAMHALTMACPEEGALPHISADSVLLATAEVAGYTAAMTAAVAQENDRRPTNGEADDLGEEAQEAERAWQCELVRHIAGDPFRQKPRLPHVPALVRELAAAVYAEDRLAVGPLHNALLEAGLERLAAHFRDGREWHPRGCWALDLLLARK